MFNLVRNYLNALNEDKVTKEGIKLYDLSGNNPVELDPKDYKVGELKRLTEDARKNNINVYTNSMAKLIGKRAVFAAPILVGGLTIASFANWKYTKTIDVSTVYRDTIVEFDEESILSESDLTYAKTFFSKDYVDDSIISVINSEVDKSSYATIYYGEGSDSLQVKFQINEDNTWNYSSHTNNLYQKSETKVQEPIADIDEEYKKLIRDVTETFIKQADLNDEEVAFLRELVNNNENDIVVKIKKCSQIEGSEYEIRTSHWFRSILVLLAEIILIYYIVTNIYPLTRVRKLDKVGSYLHEQSSYTNILKAAKEYKEYLLAAENYRISSIIEILKSYSDDKDMINEFEKRLSLNIKSQSKRNPKK